MGLRGGGLRKSRGAGLRKGRGTGLRKGRGLSLESLNSSGVSKSELSNWEIV